MHCTFGTNVMLHMVANVNFLNMLKVRMNFRNAAIHLDDIIRNEVEGYGCPVYRVCYWQKRAGVDVLIERAPPATRKVASWRWRILHCAVRTVAY